MRRAISRQNFAAVLLAATGQRWTIALSAEAGDPTLSAQDEAAHTARRDAAAMHPLVQLSILDAFPGARVEPVRAPAASVEVSAPPASADLPDAETIFDEE